MLVKSEHRVWQTDCRFNVKIEANLGAQLSRRFEPARFRDDFDVFGEANQNCVVLELIDDFDWQRWLLGGGVEWARLVQVDYLYLNIIKINKQKWTHLKRKVTWLDALLNAD